MEITRICLDTSVIIDFLKGREQTIPAVKRAIKRSDCFLTSITVYELLFGVARTKKEIREEALLGTMTILPLDEQAARRAAFLHADLIKINQDVGIKDVLISAICIENKLPILTTNTRHFKRITELTSFSPSEFLDYVS